MVGAIDARALKARLSRADEIALIDVREHGQFGEGHLFFAGYSPGGPEDEFQMPSFDDLLKQFDKDKDGALSRDEVKGSPFEDFFDSWDMNKDGKVTRDEWDNLIKFMSEGKSAAFALKAGGEGDVTNSHVLWKQTKGLPQVSSGLVYRGQYLSLIHI